MPLSVDGTSLSASKDQTIIRVPSRFAVETLITVFDRHSSSKCFSNAGAAGGTGFSGGLPSDAPFSVGEGGEFGPCLRLFQGVSQQDPRSSRISLSTDFCAIKAVAALQSFAWF